jgi:hypothetical protein
MNFHKSIVLFILVCCILGFGLPNPIPFTAGERFTYRLTCLGMEAGIGYLEIGESSVIGGVDCFHFINRIESTGIFSNFFYVRDRIDAYAGRDDLLTRLYKKSETEGKNSDSYTMIFDQANNTVTREDSTIRVLPNTRDELTTFYYLRTLDLVPGQVFDLPNTDGNQVRTLRITVGKKETINTPAGSFPAIQVSVDMANAASIFSGKVQAKLWLSDDARRMVIRLETSLAVGSLAADLVEYRLAAQ